MGSNPKGRLYQTIIDQLLTIIREKDLQPGDKIPSERELAEQFHVSRVPVREAVKVMEYLGYVENIPGDGTYLRKKELQSVYIEGFEVPDQIDTEVISDLFDMRILLESSACQYAAQRRDETDLARLKEDIGEARRVLNSLDMKHPDGQVLVEYRQLSLAFHNSIIQAAHNVVLEGLYKSLSELLKVSKQLTLRNDHSLYNSLLAHELILSKIIMQDGEGARLAMVEHLSDAKARMAAR